MYNIDPYNVFLAIATDMPVLLMTAFVLQGHICALLNSQNATNVHANAELFPDLKWNESVLF